MCVALYLERWELEIFESFLFRSLRDTFLLQEDVITVLSESERPHPGVPSHPRNLPIPRERHNPYSKRVMNKSSSQKGICKSLKPKNHRLGNNLRKCSFQSHTSSLTTRILSTVSLWLSQVRMCLNINETWRLPFPTLKMAS